MTAPRRSRRAAPGSDDEDGEAPSQDVEVVEDAEPRERKSLKKGKPSSKRAPSRRAGSDDDDEDDIPEIDVNNFHDQPLQKDAAVKLNGALSDWQMAESKLVSVDRNPYNVVISAAEAVTEYGDEQAGPVRAPVVTGSGGLTSHIDPRAAGRGHARAHRRPRADGPSAQRPTGPAPANPLGRRDRAHAPH